MWEDSFTFDIIEETDNLREREQYYIEQLKPSYNNYRAKGWNTKRYKETSKQYKKEWYKIHRDERLAYGKAYYQTHRDEKLAHDKAYHQAHRDMRLAYGKAYRQAHRDEHLAKSKDYNNRLCLYAGETLTLSALTNRFFRQGIPHARLEAKKYLI